MRKSFLFLTIVVIAISSLNGFAQGPGQGGFFSFSLGPGVFIRNNPRKNNTADNVENDPIVQPIPFMFFRAGPFQIRGRGVALGILRYPAFSLQATASWGGDRYKADGMSPRRGSIFAGVGMRLFDFRLNHEQDTMSRSNGSITTLTYNKRFFPFDKWIFNLSAGLEYMDENYSDFFFGVREEEETTERTAYRLDGVVNYLFRFTPTWLFAERWSATTGIFMKYFGSEIRKSPTMDKDLSLGTLIGVSYRFL